MRGRTVYYVTNAVLVLFCMFSNFVENWYVRQMPCLCECGYTNDVVMLENKCNDSEHTTSKKRRLSSISGALICKSQSMIQLVAIVVTWHGSVELRGIDDSQSVAL